MRWLGVLALAGTAIHWAYHLYHQRPWDLLWACHLAAALIGLGCLLDWPPVVGIGVLWLCVGLPLWVLDLAMGEEFAPTSLLTHVGGLTIGLVFVGYRGMPAGSWWQAILALMALQQLCRWVTPPDKNVNMAFAVYKGWETWFPSYLWYWVFFIVALALVFAGAEFGLRFLFDTNPRSPEASG